ncbi:hypothetical protein [Chthoniobacter flavus]|nr:hypothetical protein [Chthoniobacter flavus]
MNLVSPDNPFVKPQRTDSTRVVHLSFAAAANQAYRIERSLDGWQWAAIGLVPAGEARMVEIASSPSGGRRFYRAVPTAPAHLLQSGIGYPR